jgi:hypothetical protein
MKLSFVVLMSALAMGNPDRPDNEDPNKKKTSGEVGEISGYYTCRGQEMNGKSYTGLCVIAKQKDVYVVNWVIGTGSTFSGIGIRQGNTLAISWTLPNDRGGFVRGVNLYRLEAGENGPRLIGRWATMPGPGVLASETLNFLKAFEAEEQ